MDNKILPLVEAVGARYQSLSVDPRLVNAFAEKEQLSDVAHVYKRPAFKDHSTLDAGGGTARGLHNWQGNVYAVVDDTVYKNGVSIGTVANSGTYSFTQTLSATPRLFLHNGTNAYTITTADVIAAVVDADYPASTVSGAVYLDGTVYVMTSAAAIQGSAAAGNDATSWDPLNLILAQVEPTAGIHIAKQLVYVLALKSHYTEAFYDAGNSVGSPLGVVQGAKMNFGCVDARTVRDIGGDLMWVANSGEGGYVVVMVTGLKLEVVSTPPVERLLSAASGAFYSWNAKIQGHRLYGVTSVGGNWTLVFDLTSRLWYHWTNAAGDYLPYAFSCQGSGSTTQFLHATNGKLYTLDTLTYQDGADGTPFPCSIYTPNFDAGSRRHKTLPWMCLVGDQINTTVDMYYSDDDYTTWSAAQSINMNLDQPIVTGLGSFTKRAFRFTHQANTAFRLRGVELALDGAAT